jgi:integrase
MRGSVFKRCTCPVRRDEKGRRITCGKQHGSWSYKVDVPSTSAQRKQLVKGGYPTKREAEEAMAEALAKAARGQLAAPSRLTVGGYLERWLATVRPTLAAAAWTNYRSCIELYVRPHLEDALLAKLTGTAVTSLYADLIARGGRNGKPLSPTTVRIVHRVLNKALNDAVRDDLLLVNPVAKAVPPKRRRYEATVWTAQQAARFLTAVRTDPLYAAWLVALSCGLRRGELAGLRWRDLDLDRGTLSVTTQRTTDSDYNIITKAPKGTGRRVIDLGAGTVDALRAHRDAQLVLIARQQGWLFPVEGAVGTVGWIAEWRPTDVPDRPSASPEHVFLGEDLEPIHPQRLTELFQKAAAAAGVPVIRLHDARHSCATLALDAGVHPKVVQQLLGHSTWSTTMDLYSHRVERLQRDATERIESLLLPTEEGPDGSGVAATG